MSARDDYPNAWATAEKGRAVDASEIAAALQEIDDLRADHVEAVALFGAASAELSALKARHAEIAAMPDDSPFDPSFVPAYLHGYREAMRQVKAILDAPARRCDGCAHYRIANSGGSRCVHDDLYAEDAVVTPDHACNAWKAKP